MRGAAGGIGVMAVQLAASRGATVLATTRGRHAERLRRLGAHAVVPDDAAVVDQCDVVVDLVAGDAVPAFIDRLAPNGRYVIAGIAAGMPPAEFGAPLLGGFRRSLSVATFSLDTVPPAAVRDGARRLFADLAAGRLAPVIDQRLPLDQGSAAHARLTRGGVLGKLVLQP